jgi:hypothetical protein
LLRTEPQLRSATRRYLSNGSTVDVFDGSSEGDNRRWSRVRTEDGAVGWIVSDAIRR